MREMSQCRRFSSEEDTMTTLTSPDLTPMTLTRLLTVRQRRTCALAWSDRRTHAQIGVAHGVSHWASKKRVQRARRRLRAAGIDPPTGQTVARRAPAFLLGGMENV